MTERLNMSALEIAVDIVTGNQIDGDYLEFGVFEGYSFARVYHQMMDKRRFYNVNTPIRFFAFDSFDGLPASDDKNLPLQYAAGAFSAGEKTFLKNINDQHVDLSLTTTVKKWYSDLNSADKTNNNIKKAALVYIDCDLYESTRDALIFCTDLLVDGSVIVFDDYYRHKGSPNHGIRKAWNEFLDNNPNYSATLVHSWRRVTFILHVN